MAPKAPLTSLDSRLILPWVSRVRASNSFECSICAASLASSTRVSESSKRDSLSRTSRAAKTSFFSELRGVDEEFALRWASRCHAL